MEYLKLNGQAVTESVIANVTSWSFILYCVANVLFFLIVKYYGMRDIRRGNANKQCMDSYFAFTRDDISKMHVVWCFPFYATFLPRFIITAFFVMIAGLTGDLLIVSKEDAKNTT